MAMILNFSMSKEKKCILTFHCHIYIPVSLAYTFIIKTLSIILIMFSFVQSITLCLRVHNTLIYYQIKFYLKFPYKIG